MSPRTSVIVSHTLQLLLLLEYFRPKVVQEVPITAKLARLMCVFLIGIYAFVKYVCIPVNLKLSVFFQAMIYFLIMLFVVCFWSY